MVGQAYARGSGVEKDEKKAAEWYQRAAIKGNTNAQYDLGFLFLNGRGVQQNNADAYFWFGVARKAGYRGYMVSNEVLSARMPIATVRELNRRIEDWRPKIENEDESFLK
jgi:TPR repeat protein